MKKLLSVVLLFLSCLVLSAQNRSIDKAADIAVAFLKAESPTRSAGCDLRMVWDGNPSTKSSGTPAFYLFDNVSGPGFVIVSGEESARTILGYSFDNDLDVNDLPPHFVSWMDALSDQIEFIRKHPSSRPANVAANVGQIVTKLQTALWNQDDPFNRQCPKDGAMTSITGCVSTATAIVMRYHKWPDAGTGTLPAYTTVSKGINVPERSLGTAYDWDQMPLEYNRGQYTENQAEQVSRLMSDCGSMVQMDYTSEASAASEYNIPATLPVYMKYDTSIGVYSRGAYSASEWHSMLEKEIKTNGPVIYSGRSTSSGHCFVLDGYTTEHYYSVNWGWGGNNNGYFALDAMDSSSSYEPYNYMQTAILNVKKFEGGTPEIRAMIVPYEGINGLQVSETSLKPGIPFNIKTGLIQNYSSIHYKGKMGLAVADKDDNVLEMILEHEADLPPYYGYRYDNVVMFKTEPKNGYSIIAVIWDYNNGVWRKVRGDKEQNCIDSIPLEDAYTIEESTQFEYSTKSKEILLKLKDDVLVRLSDESYKNLTDLLILSGNEVRLKTSGLPAGKYMFVLSKGEEYKEIYFHIGKK